MKIVQINSCSGIGSTGKICESISKILDENGIENYILYFSGKTGFHNSIKCSTQIYEKMQALYSRILGNYGFNSWISTKIVIHHLEKIKPDIVHLHNLHGHEVNIERLLKYLKNKKIRIVWTMHDCWLFTGYCPYFTMIKCEQWKNGCHQCLQRKTYSWFFDMSRWNQLRKIIAMEGADITFVTPSEWLARLVRQSKLKEHPVVVINNGINLSIFKPTPSGFRKKYGFDIPVDSSEKKAVQKKYMVLGVSFDWGKSKGLDTFINLSHVLSSEYVIVLVGTDESVDRILPANMISIHRTSNQTELAQIYSSADVFVNLTREDNYPTVNMEAVACGTPVITMDVGGAAEMVDESSGVKVNARNIELLQNTIEKVVHSDYREGCIAKSKEYGEDLCFSKYIGLYKNLMN